MLCWLADVHIYVRYVYACIGYKQVCRTRAGPRLSCFEQTLRTYAAPHVQNERYICYNEHNCMQRSAKQIKAQNQSQVSYKPGNGNSNNIYDTAYAEADACGSTT